MNKLSDYEKQAGAAGQQETYAESAARHAEGKDQDTPHLKNMLHRAAEWVILV